MGAVSSVFEAVGDIVSDVGDVVLNVVEGVGDIASNAVEAVIEDPARLLPLALAIAVPGAGAAVGSYLGASGAGAAALGGAVIGGTTAALTGGDPLTGAVLGGAGGYASDYFSSGGGGGSPAGSIFTDTTADYIPSTDFGAGADYGFSSGNTIGGFSVPAYSNVGYGLTGNIPFEGFQSITSPSLYSMGGGQGLTATTPQGVVGELGLTPTGASPVLGDPRSFINNPDILGRPVVGIDPAYAPAAGASSAMNDALLKAIKIGGAGLLGSRLPSVNFSTSPMAAYQQPNTMPVYSPEYFQAIQENYNTLLPTVPKDVISPLKEIYTPQKSIVNTLFGGT